MRTRIAFLVVAALVAAFAFAPYLYAEPLVTIETVRVGDPGNTADTRVMVDKTTGYGAVAHEFAISKFEVTIGQYAAFLNSVAASDPYGLYNTNMASDKRIAGIQRSGGPGSYTYSAIGPFGATPTGAISPVNRPIAYISWLDSARFCNWLHNGATNGADTESGAYTLNGATNGTGFVRNSTARWWIPSEDEWYKAAYYKGGGTNSGYWLYPTKSDTLPGNAIGASTNQANGNIAVTPGELFSMSQNYLTEVGAFSNSASAYGTFDQAGNLFEWMDTVASQQTNNGVVEDLRAIRGEAFDMGDVGGSDGRFMFGPPYGEDYFTGFRVATVSRPRILLAERMTNGFSLSWSRGANAVAVQRRTSLKAGSWQTISSNNISGLYLDTGAPAESGFYRIVVP